MYMYVYIYIIYIRLHVSVTVRMYPLRRALQHCREAVEQGAPREITIMRNPPTGPAVPFEKTSENGDRTNKNHRKNIGTWCFNQQTLGFHGFFS